jgi:uncharacterized protein YukJ
LPYNKLSVVWNTDGSLSQEYHWAIRLAAAFIQRFDSRREWSLMAMHYGVLRARVDVFKREDDFDTPHLQIRVIDGHNQAWRVPVNVLSKDQSFLIFHRVDPLQSHPILAGLPQIAAGFTPLPPPSRSASTAVDYFRAPLFDWPTGVAAPHTGPNANDDLQDVLVMYLEQLQAQNGELFVFGEPFPAPGQAPNPRPIDHEFDTVRGVHNIHMNQGNPNPGPFAGDNGVFQDGGLVLKFPTRYVGLLLRFQTQWLPTNNTTGDRLPGAQPIPPGGFLPDISEGPSIVSHPIVYIERALINPVGDDVGKEVVVIGNTTTSSVDLTGWSIVDRNNHAEVLSGLLLPPGESRRVVLSGTAVQLGNKGGTIRLKNPAGDQVHAVSYSKEDAQQDSRYIRFNT